MKFIKHLFDVVTGLITLVGAFVLLLAISVAPIMLHPFFGVSPGTVVIITPIWFLFSVGVGIALITYDWES